MGSQNVRRILLATPPLDISQPRARETLILMALLAHDEHGQYFGGLAWLCQRMAYQDNEHSRRLVQRRISHLVDRGYVKPTDARRGRHRVYQLLLPELLGPRSGYPQGHSSEGLTGRLG